MGKGSKICPKRRISRISEAADLVPVRSHKLVKIANRGICISYKGLRYGDQLRKRVALSEIAVNQRKESVRYKPFYRYKQYDMHLYKNRGCFDIFHKES
jgi:hypothetical protein